MRRSPRVLLAVLFCLLAAAPAAEARYDAKKAIWGPVEVNGESQFPIYHQLGVGRYEYSLGWNQVAPTRPQDAANPADPAYQWPAELAEAVRQASKYHIKMTVMIIGAPSWANGGRDWNWAPTDPHDFATFAGAAAKKYPSVHSWMIWSEPTKAQNFQPLVGDDGKPLRTAAQLAPVHKYAEILDDSYGVLKSISKKNMIIGGNTYTIGVVRPLNWVQALRLPDGKLPRMDLWGHNAFTARYPDLDAPPLGGGWADFCDIDQLAHALDRHFKDAPLRKERHLKIFDSEFTVPTDHANFEFNFFTDHKTQAKWIAAALRITRSYNRIATFGYLGLYDDPVRPDGQQDERGLITRNGVKKPAFNAFKNG